MEKKGRRVLPFRPIWPSVFVLPIVHAAQMSASSTAAESHVLEGLPYCPACQSAFSTLCENAIPQSFACGHVACTECATASAYLDPPACPVCFGDASSGYVADVAVASYADAFFAKQGGDPVAPPVPREWKCPEHTSWVSDLCLDDDARLCELCERGPHDGHTVVGVSEHSDHRLLRAFVEASALKCSNAHASMGRDCATVSEARARLVARKAASEARLEAAAASIKAAVDAQVHALKGRLDTELKKQLKGLDAQLDRLQVAANQLACVACVCRSALQEGEPKALALAAASARRVSALAVPYEGPAACTLVEAMEDTEGVLRRIRDEWSWVRVGVSAEKSMQAPSVRRFDPGEETALCVTVRDNRGTAVEGLVVEDVLASVAVEAVAAPVDADCTASSGGSGGSGSDGRAREDACEVVGVNLGGVGEIEVVMVAGPRVQQASVTVNICGVPNVAGGPWLLTSWLCGPTTSPCPIPPALTPRDLVPEESVRLTAAGDIRGGGAGREYLENLLKSGTEPWNKWVHPYTQRSWVEARFTVPQRLRYIGMCSANDCPDRDPAVFTLTGTIAHSEETVELVTVSECPFNSSVRWEWLWFDVPSPIRSVPLSMVRLTVLSNGGAWEVQLGHLHFARAE